MHAAAKLNWTHQQFVGYLFARTVVWAVAIWATQPSPTFDVAEQIAWGREWLWVYPIHAGLPSWLNEIFYQIGGQTALAATSPLATSLALYAVYMLAMDLSGSRRLATGTALTTEGILYFNVLAVEFNHNVILLATTALLCALTYRAFARGGVWWFAAGLLAALAMHSKYNAVLTLFALFVWSLWSPSARKCYRSGGPYIAVAVIAIAWLLPSAAALLAQDFSPVHYALNRAANPDGGGIGWHHLTYPIKFSGTQIAALLPAFILCLLAGISKSIDTDTDTADAATNNSLSANNTRFIFAVAFVPIITALIISVIGGIRLQSMWGAAMLTFIPLWLFLTYRHDNLFAKRRWTRGIIIFNTLALLAVVITFSVSPHFTGKGKRVHYPGPAIARHIDGEWQKHFPDRPLRYVLGARHSAPLFAFYSAHRPSVVINYSRHNNFASTAGIIANNPWINRSEWQQNSGIIIWYNDEKIPAYPRTHHTAHPQPAFTAPYRTAADIPPLTIHWAILQPK